jgi:hypothetical protein
VPVHIGGTDKFGLGKKDPWRGFNPRERYVYKLDMGAEIAVDKYRNLSMPKAVRVLTREIGASLFAARRLCDDSDSSDAPDAETAPAAEGIRS